VKTCGSCPHLKNGRCDVPEKSGRKCRIKRQYPICRWWEAERWLIAVRTGEIRLSDDYEYVFRTLREPQEEETTMSHFQLGA